MATKRNPEERPAKKKASDTSVSATKSAEQVGEDAASAAGPPDDREQAADAQGPLQELAIGYYKNLSETASELSRQAAKVFHISSDAVQRNTWESIGVAAGVGLVIGFLID